MSSSVANKSSMVRSSRKFPEDPELLTTELTRSWTEIANAINDRVIGLISTSPTITGKQYSYGSKKLGSLWQLFQFSDSSLTINHQINNLNQVVAQSGWFTDGSVWYPLPYVDVLNVTNQVGVSTTSTQIIVAKGTTAPTISSGYVILEWLQGTT
jgi:hypothetical protein